MRMFSFAATFAVWSLPGLLVSPLLAQKVGDPAPDVQWQHTIDFAGAPAGKLSELRGSVVLLEFWATWCGPCKQQIPHLNELHAQKSELGLVVIGVTNDDQATVEAFRKKTPMHYPVAIAEPPEYEVQGIPHSFLIGADGKLLWRGHPATLDAKTIDDALVGARSAFVMKGMEDVAALRKAGDHGAAYQKAKDLLATGGLSEPAAAQANAWCQTIEQTVTAALGAADAAVAAKDVYATWLALEPSALRHHGVPGADVARKRYDALMADPKNKREIEAGKQFAAGQAREAVLDYDGAHKLYKAAASSFHGTAAGKQADKRARAIETENKLGFDLTCGYCKAGNAACPQHKKKKR